MARDASYDQVPQQWSRRSVLSFGAGLMVAGAGIGGGVATVRKTATERRLADTATVSEMSESFSSRVLWRANTDRKVLALTFDDGPGDVLTEPLLEHLREAKVPATFCLVGKAAYVRRELVKTQVKAGHELVNHSWSHADLSQLDDAQLHRELDRTDELINDITGRTPGMVRPPYGRINGALLQRVAETGRDVLMWDVRFHEADRDAAANTRDIITALHPGMIVLGHDAGSQNRKVGIAAVPGVIREAKDRGYTFITASEMLQLDREAGPAPA